MTCTNQTILTHDKMQRVILRTDSVSLSALLINLRKSGVAIEHIYDY
jgi:hypothetical protein